MPSTRPRKMMSLALGAALGVALLAGCGGDDDDAEADETTTTEATTATEEETTTTEEGSTTTEADDDADDDEVEADEEATEVDWQRTASEHRDRLGRRIAFDCPADGEPATIWGTGTYTDDSSVCTAAVHAGLITVADGGRVVIEVAAGQDSYEASEANGIESLEYPDWPGSFTFPAADGDDGDDGIGGDTGAKDDGPVGEGTDDDGSGIGDPLEDDDEG